MVGKNQPISEAAIQTAHTALEFLEKFLEGQRYSCGDEMTIADISFATSILALKIWLPIEENRYPNITSWYKRMEALPYFESENAEGHEKLRHLIHTKMDEVARK